MSLAEAPAAGSLHTDRIHGATREGQAETRMDTYLKQAPLSVPELEQLGSFLDQVTNPRALSVEGMDGLFCALIAGPAWVTPSEYLPLLWGGPLADQIVAFNVAHVNAMIWLFTRHWNSIVTELDRGTVHPPLIVNAVAGATAGRAWAQGFMRGVNFVQVGWGELLKDETSELYRILQIAQEADPPVLLDVLPQETSGEILPWLGPAVAAAYRHFLDRRLADRLMAELMEEVTSRWYSSPD